MRWSFRLFRVGETEVRIHVTFLLLVGWYAWTGWRTSGPAGAVNETLFVLLLFTSVLLHEFGHILAARGYGIPTPEILLSPIGGIARIAAMPQRPRQELLVSLAGPAVTLGIIVVGWAALLATGEAGHFVADIQRNALWPMVIATNMALLVFNLIPAFPMDGGRVLRAALAGRLGMLRGTLIAARAGQVIAIVFVIAGLRGNIILLLIGMFVLTAAEAELQYAKRSAMIDQLRAEGRLPEASRHPDNTLGP
ncbi:MAG: site-2 protease family protein [Gemmatimonadales bacterium]